MMRWRRVPAVEAVSPIGGRRAAISAVFLANGFGIGVWAAFIPIIKERLGLSDGMLAVVLFGAAAGAIVAMPVSGMLCDRFGSRRITAMSGAVFGAALGATTAAPALALIVPAAFGMGAGNGAMDVAMNVNGVALQARAARPIMSSLHGLFSVGTFLAAAAMAQVVALRLPHLAASAAAALLIFAASLALRPHLTRDMPRREAHRAQTPGRIPPRLFLLGLAAICGAVCEGSLVEWSGVYLRESLHVTIAAALGGFAAYAVAMSASRFCGDWIVHRTGPVALVRASGLLGAAGLAVALIVHTYAAVLLGFFITGLGLANVSPLVYGAGGDDAETGAGAGVAMVTTLGYSGFLIGPALIGFTAQKASIDLAFAFIASFALGIALLAPVLRAGRRARAA
jgi:MFS family permease